MDSVVEARFRIISAAHRFVSDAVPLRDGDSRAALSSFLGVAMSTDLPMLEMDAVLLRTLALLDRHTDGRLPTLVEQYLSTALTRSRMLARFQQCVESVLRYRGIGNLLVQRAITIIEERYGDSALNAKAIAGVLGTRPERLAGAFTAQTGMNTTEYLRNLRLERAASLLLGSDKTVKEVWAKVGYNHASNFDHDFRHRFGEAPRQYRTHGLCAGPAPGTGERPRAFDAPVAPIGGRTVLIIDDDLGSRETIGRYLALEGYRVIAAATGEDGLREAERINPEAVLLDYHLPDVDGFEWLRAFRALQPRARVVMFSADWDLEAKLDELRALGATFLLKLCDLDDVRKALFP